MHGFCRTRSHCIVALLILVGGAIASVPPVAAQSQRSAQATIREAVITAITQFKGAPPPHGALVDVKRLSADQQWAFGTIVLLTPKREHPTDALDARHHDDMPEAFLWIARSTATGWQAAIDYTPPFDQLVRAAPDSVISTKEQAILQAATPAVAPGVPASTINSTHPPNGHFALPWTPGQRWKLSGGPHNWSSRSPAAWSALDFAHGEGDGRVLAARDGLIYRPCGMTTYVLIRHADGWQTDYYHLTNIPYYQEGSWVESGRYLGNISTAVDCGGSASGPHVHFNIRYNGEHIPWDGRTIGGWTIRNGAQPYAGCAERPGTRVCAGDLITNHDVPPTAYDDAHTQISYTGQWAHQSGVANTYGNTLSAAQSTGSAARLTFTGRRISLIYSLMPDGGRSAIYIDGRYRETIAHRAAEVRRQVIKTWELGYGVHTVEVRASGDDPIDVDAFVINLTTVSPGAYDNTHSQWRSIGSWQQIKAVAGAYQDTVSWSDTSGSTMRITFTGERVMYVYSKTPYRGIAAITIDGVHKQYIDLYAPEIRRQQHTTFTELGPGVHVLHITVTGKKNAAASGYGVDVDRIVIPSDYLFVPIAMRR